MLSNSMWQTWYLLFSLATGHYGVPNRDVQPTEMSVRKLIETKSG